MEFTKMLKGDKELLHFWPEGQTDCLTGDTTSCAFGHFYGRFSHTGEVTAQICPKTLTVLLKVPLLCPGALRATRRMRVGKIPTPGSDGRSPAIRFYPDSLPSGSKLTMLQLVWLQGHKYTAPPSMMWGWLVLAFGAPIKTLKLDSRKEEITGSLQLSASHFK